MIFQSQRTKLDFFKMHGVHGDSKEEVPIEMLKRL